MMMTDINSNQRRHSLGTLKNNALKILKMENRIQVIIIETEDAGNLKEKPAR